MKRILCLSGGGVRGVAQLQVLKKLEEDYGKPLHEVYDLIIGTSVGAINAAIIASGAMSMEEVDEKYIGFMKKIFKKRGFFKKPKYDRDNFLDIWDEIAGSDFKMGESKTRLMITTVDLVTDTNLFYKSWHEDDSDEKLGEIVTRSFAAPLYFGQIVDIPRQQVYSDGGIGNANLPLDEAKTQAESYGWYRDGEEVEIHAIGTLTSDEVTTFKDVAKGKWTAQLMDYMKPAQGGLARVQSAEDQIRRMKYVCKHIPEIKFRYWDGLCNSKHMALDDTKYVEEYRQGGIKMAESPLVICN